MLNRNLLIAFFILASGVVCLWSCEKDPPVRTEEIPPYTDTGANVLSCYVDGKLFMSRCMPKYKISSARFWHPERENPNSRSLFINGNANIDSPYESLQLRIASVFDTGKYTLSEPDINYDYTGIFERGPKHYDHLTYRTTYQYKMEVYVRKLDTVKKVVSGIFSGKMKIWVYGPEYLTITNGQFDFIYDEY